MAETRAEGRGFRKTDADWSTVWSDDSETDVAVATTNGKRDRLFPYGGGTRGGACLEELGGRGEREREVLAVHPVVTNITL